MNDIKNALLSLDSFDENNKFVFEHNIKLYYVSEVLRFKMYDRIEKYDLNYCEDAILNLIDLTVKTLIWLTSKNLVYWRKLKNLYDGVLEYEDDSDTEKESVEYDDYYELSEDSDTGEIIVIFLKFLIRNWYGNSISHHFSKIRSLNSISFYYIFNWKDFLFQ